MKTTDHWGRRVSCSPTTVDHIAAGHPEVRPELVIQAVENADKRTKGRKNCELLWARGIGPAKWLVVVVSYQGDRGFVRTAYGKTKDPKASELL